MIKQDFGKMIASGWKQIQKHNPEILTGVGIAGMVTTTIMAVKATPKALKLIEEKEEELNVEQLPTKELIKTTWKCYIPSVIIAGASIACIVYASSTNLRRNTALAAAYTISEATLKEYQDKVVEKIGEKKEQEIREEVGGSKMAKNPIREVILTENGGNTTCYDVVSGRYFKSNRDTINRIVNDLNREMRTEMYVTLNEFYYELGLDTIKIGDDLGWNIEKGYIDITFSSHLDANGTPCLVLDYKPAPIYDYR